jgi:hypothetical protein
MSEIVYRIAALLEQLLVSVPVGTNLALYHLLWTVLSGRLLLTRGALFPALADLGLPAEAVRRAEAALCYGRWTMAQLLTAWQLVVAREGGFSPHAYHGYRPVPVDLVGFFRPRLVGCTSKHYHSQADKALPAVVLGLAGPVGRVGRMRLCVPRHIVRFETQERTDPDRMRRLLQAVAKRLAPEEVAIGDRQFAPALMQACQVERFVVRAERNFTAQRNALPAYSGHGRPPQQGEVVRPLARFYRDHWIAATPPDKVARWKVDGRTIRALIFENLVARDARPGAKSFRCMVLVDARYKQPLVLVTNLAVSAQTVWCLYHDRWPIEQVPLAAKQMLGAHNSFVFGQQSRVRLPELALLAGHILSYVAATAPAVASGFWDRCARPSCGRLRRVLLRLHFADLPVPRGQLRKKDSPTGHLPKGVQAHRRQKAGTDSRSAYPRAA